MDDFGTVNGIYANFFGGHKPARSAVEVSRLPKDVLFEIECIARYVRPFVYGIVIHSYSQQSQEMNTTVILKKH